MAATQSVVAQCAALIRELATVSRAAAAWFYPLAGIATLAITGDARLATAVLALTVPLVLYFTAVRTLADHVVGDA